MAFPRLKHVDQIFDLREQRVGTLPAPSERGVWIRLRGETPRDELRALAKYVARHSGRVVLDVGRTVDLSECGHLEGATFIVINDGRDSFEGLEALPVTLERLSVRQQTRKLPLAALGHLSALRELELDGPADPRDGGGLSSLHTLGWVHGGDEANAWIEAQPALRDLALHTAKNTRLPAVPAIERLSLFYPSKLASLVGVGALKNLEFLRIDQPRAMERLGTLAKLSRLRTIALVRAHVIGSLDDLASAPALETLVVTLTKLGPEPFLPLAGRVKRAFLQLKGRNDGARALEMIGAERDDANCLHTPTPFDF